MTLEGVNVLILFIALVNICWIPKSDGDAGACCVNMLVSMDDDEGADADGDADSCSDDILLLELKNCSSNMLVVVTLLISAGLLPPNISSIVLLRSYF